MNDRGTLTAPTLEEPALHPIPPSGDVLEDFLESKPIVRGGAPWTRLASSVLFAFATTATTFPLPPPPYEHRPETSSVVCFVAIRRGRRITLAEARALALSAMANAEQRRASYAELEAKLHAIWEGGA